MSNATVHAMVFNTCNLNWSLVVEINGLKVHTSIAESQAKQIHSHMKFRNGVPGERKESIVGKIRNDHEIFWKF